MSHQQATWIESTKLIGISLFIGALLFFITLLSMSNYMLNSSIVEAKLKGEKRDAFQAAAQVMLGKN